MKILTVYHRYKEGGSYHRLRMMLDAYRDAGDEVYYIAAERYPFEIPRLHSQILYTPFKNLESSSFKLYFLLVAPLYALYVCCKNRIDRLVALGTVSAFVQSLASLLLRKKMVTLVRADSNDVLRSETASYATVLVNRLLERIGLSFSDRIIVNNRDLKEKIQSRIPKRRDSVRLLYNNVVPPPERSPQYMVGKNRDTLGITEEDFLMVTVGVINRGKNLELLLKAMRCLELKNVKLLIVGDVTFKQGDSRVRLETMAKKMGIDGQVVFAGWREPAQVHEILDMADLFVFPSLHEGSPNALLEALGHDKPCLGSWVPGIAEVLHFDELMFDPYDERDLKQKVERAVLDPGYLCKIRDLCKERKKMFTFDWKKAFLEATRGSSTRDRVAMPE